MTRITLLSLVIVILTGCGAATSPSKVADAQGPAPAVDWATASSWICAPDAPGGGYKINVEAKIICKFGGGGPSECISGSELPIQRTWTGLMAFGDHNISFVEFEGWSASKLLDVKIYEPKFVEHNSPVHHADLIPSGKAVTDPTAPFVANSLEIRCSQVQ